MTATLVFLHGRGQEFRDPADLQKEWFASLTAGVLRADGVLAADTPVVTPYYGNLLYRLTAELAQAPGERDALPADPDEPGPLHPQLPPEIGRLERRMVDDMRAAVADAAPTVAVPPGAADGLEDILSWGGVRDVLTWLARRTWVDQAVIERHLRDVSVYLTRGRQEVLDHITAAIPGDVPLVLVAHSLGTVVARDLLSDAGLRGRTRLWVTFGSPLGIEAVQSGLLDRGTVNPGVEWISVHDVNDIVALGHPLRPTWGDPLVDVEVENEREPHSIARYLAHPQAAGRIAAEVAR